MVSNRFSSPSERQRDEVLVSSHIIDFSNAEIYRNESSPDKARIIFARSRLSRCVPYTNRQHSSCAHGGFNAPDPHTAISRGCATRYRGPDSWSPGVHPYSICISRISPMRRWVDDDVLSGPGETCISRCIFHARELSGQHNHQ